MTLRSGAWKPYSARVLTTAAVTALLGTTALASPAMASEKIKLSLGGFMEQWIGFVDQDDIDAGATAGRDYNAWDIQSDSEVFVEGSTNLDNGITVGVYIELEVDTAAAAAADVSNLFLESETLGKIELGGAENESWVQHNASPDVGITNHDGDYPNWIITPGNFTDRTVTGFNDDGTAEKINYFSPRFAGFAVSASYTPYAASAGTQPMPNLAAGGDGAAWSATVTYDGEVAGVAVTADASYGTLMSTEVSGGLEVWSGGVNLGFGDITVGGSYANLNDKISGSPDGATAASQSGYAFDIGVAYGTGPYAVSLTWLRSETEGVISTDGEDEKNSVMLSGAYTLGPGVDWMSSVFWVDYDDETGVAINNNDGWGVVTGLTLTF